MAHSLFGEAVSLTHMHQRGQQNDFLDLLPMAFAGDWRQSLNDVLTSEGGNDDDPRDPGGRTSRGIIQSEWNTWRAAHPGNNWPVDVWKAPQDQVEAIYKEKYWTALRCDELAPGVDYCLFDYGVNSGIGRAGKVLRRLLALSESDWRVTEEVLAALKVRDPQAVINQICDERLKFLRGLATWSTFGNGWNRRVFEVRHDAGVMAKAGPPKPTPVPEAPELHDLGHRVRQAMLAKGYPWFDDQNVVSLEGIDPDGTPNANRPNAFDDVKMVLDGQGKIIGGPWEGTTQPGKYWTEHPMAAGGAFIIALGPQACWTPGEYHGNTVWRQAEDSTIMGFRDPNCTYKRIGQPIKHGDIGVHHHGGWNMRHTNIGKTAAGCQVIRLINDQTEFMRLTLRCPRYLQNRHGYRLTATVLEAKDVAEAMPSTAAPPKTASSAGAAAPVQPKPQMPPATHFSIGAGFVAAIIGLAQWAGARPETMIVVFIFAALLAGVVIHLAWEHKS